MSTLENNYNLTPLESMLVNKLMLKGFKLETEENFNLAIPLSSNISKEHKNNDKIKTNEQILNSFPDEHNLMIFLFF